MLSNVCYISVVSVLVTIIFVDESSSNIIDSATVGNKTNKTIEFIRTGALPSIAAPNGTVESQTVLLHRTKRYQMRRQGRCNTLETSLEQGLEWLHDVPIQRETFFIRPGATFRRVVIQAHLDNKAPFRGPKVYDKRVELRASDLNKMNIPSHKWISVAAEVAKDGQAWTVSVSVGRNWKRKAVVKNFGIFYGFHGLVISGEGGCEWSFDCLPDDIVIKPGALEDDVGTIDTIHYSVWWLALSLTLIFVTIILFLCGVAYFCSRSRNKNEANHSIISRTISFRKPARSTKQQTKEECIYEDISALQQLRKTFSSMGVEGYSKCTPPPLPPANIPLGGSSRHGNKGKKEGDYDVITVTVPQQTGNQYTIEDQDWYGSLEIHNTGGCNPKLDRGHTVDGAQTSPPRLTKDNDYSNCCPTSNTATEAENYNIYVDMSKGVRYTTR